MSRLFLAPWLDKSKQQADSGLWASIANLDITGFGVKRTARKSCFLLFLAVQSWVSILTFLSLSVLTVKFFHDILAAHLLPSQVQKSVFVAEIKWKSPGTWKECSLNQQLPTFMTSRTTAGLKHISYSLNPKVVWAALSRGSQQCNSSSVTIAWSLAGLCDNPSLCGVGLAHLCFLKASSMCLTCSQGGEPSEECPTGICSRWSGSRHPSSTQMALCLCAHCHRCPAKPGVLQSKALSPVL